MNENIIKTTFEDITITTIFYKDRPVWVASEVAAAMGYSDASKPAQYITGKWEKEFKEGHHHLVLEGEDLQQFKVLAQPTDLVGRRINRITLLTEFGVNKLIMKSDMLMGIQLREHIATEIMPQLRRGIIESKPDELKLHMKKEELKLKRWRLQVSDKNAQTRALAQDLKNREAKARVISEALSVAEGWADESSLGFYKVKTAEIVSGESLSGIYPKDFDPGLGVNEIASLLDHDPGTIQRAIEDLDLKSQKDKVISVPFEAKRKGSTSFIGRLVPHIKYLKSAVEMIEDHLKDIETKTQQRGEKPMQEELFDV